MHDVMGTVSSKKRDIGIIDLAVALIYSIVSTAVLCQREESKMDCLGNNIMSDVRVPKHVHYISEPVTLGSQPKLFCTLVV